MEGSSRSVCRDDTFAKVPSEKKDKERRFLVGQKGNRRGTDSGAAEEADPTEDPEAAPIESSTPSEDTQTSSTGVTPSHSGILPTKKYHHSRSHRRRSNISKSTDTEIEADQSSNETNNNASLSTVLDVVIERTMVLVKTNSISKLALSGRGIGDKGASILALVLERNHSLREMDLSYNNITADGMLCIADALTNNTTLSYLNIEGNLISHGGDVLAKILQNNKTITSIQANKTGLNLVAWERALKFNCTLTLLEFDQDENTDTIQRNIKEHLRNNKTLRLAQNFIENDVNNSIYLSAKFPELFRNSIKNWHIAIIHQIIKRECDPDLLFHVIENCKTNTVDVNIMSTMIKMLLSAGYLVTPHMLNETEGLSEVHSILRKYEKDHILDLSMGCYRWRNSAPLPPTICSLILSGNSITEIDSRTVEQLVLLPKLNTLDLSKNLLKSIPENFRLLTQLKVLNISDNKINSLPYFLEDLKLQKFEFKGNPFIYSLPEEVFKKGLPKILQYMKDIQCPTKPWERIKLIVVGEENVGKTHLINTFKKKDYPKNVSTDGVDVEQIVIGPKKIKYLIYDFGGQEVFYPTHQFFLSEKAVYIVVFNICVPDRSRTEYWLRKLKSLSSIPPHVILVGTHLDEITDLTEVNHLCQRWKSTFKNIQGYIFVSCLTGENLKELKQLLNDVSAKQKLLGTLVPTSWYNVDKLLRDERSRRKILKWDEYKDLVSRNYITNSTSLTQMTEFLMDTGGLLWFNEPGLRELVILDDNWLASVMASIVSFKNNWKDGLLPHKTLAIVWKNISGDLHRILLGILQQFEILFPKRGDPNTSIVPSMLPNNPNTNFTTFGKWNLDEYHCLERVYTFKFLPVGFFARYVARMFQDCSLFCHDSWKNGFLFLHSSILEEDRNEEQLISTALEMGFQRGLVEFNEGATKPQLIIKVWYSKKYIKPDQNLLLRAIVICDGLINDSYKKWRTGLSRVAAVCRPEQRYEFEYDLLLLKMQKGEEFVSPFPNTIEVSEVETTSSNDRDSLTIEPHDILQTNSTSSSKDQEQPSFSIALLAPDIALTSITTFQKVDLSIISEIGRGGFGVVYKAQLNETKKIIAVKEIITPHEFVKSMEFFDFQHEVFMMTRLESTYLVSMLGIQLQPLRIVLEYVPGRDLSKIVRDQRISNEEFHWKLRCKIALDIARGMSYLHTQFSPPITHRDLRSPNCFVVSMEPDWAGVNCKIADFGLAQFVYSPATEPLLTWQWLAPEVLSTQKISYDERSDIFSFGIVLWEIATRSFPYDEYHHLKITKEELPPPGLESDKAFLESMEKNGWNFDGEVFRAYEWNKHLAIEQITDNELRPSIPEDTPSFFSHLIRSCWQTSPSARPTFPSLCDSFLELLPEIPKENEKEPIKVPQSPIRYSSYKAKYSGDDTVLNSPFCVTGIVTTMEIVDSSVWAGFADGKIQVFDIKTTRKKFEILAHKHHKVYCLHSVGSSIWSGGGDNLICVWSTKNIKCKKVLKGHSNPVLSILSIDSDTYKKISSPTVWSGDADGTIIIWRGDNKIKKFSVSSDFLPIHCMQLVPSPEGFMTVWIGSSAVILVFNAVHHTMINTLKAGLGNVSSMRLVGGYLWSSTLGGMLYIWDISNLSLPPEVPEGLQNHAITSICLVSNKKDTSKQIWAGSTDKSIYVIQPKNYTILQKLELHTAPITNLLLVENSFQVWSSSKDKSIVRWHYY